MSVNFQDLPHPGIHTLVPYKPGKSIEELHKEQGISHIVKLASNENVLGCSPLALEALRTLDPHIIATYPSPMHHPLMPKLAKHLGIDMDQLFISNGSDCIFGLLMNCFALHLNKHILTHEYSFRIYSIQAHGLGIPINSVAIDADWHINMDNLIQACNKDTAIIFLANPNNPTGLFIPEGDLKHLLNHIPEHTLVVIDEAYYEFAAKEMNCDTIPWLSLYPNLILTRTFSKIYGLAGLRLGYMMANPSIVNILRKVQLPFVVNQMALTAGYAALDDKEFLQKSLQLNEQGIQQVRLALDQLNIPYLPSVCNFLTFDCKEDSLPLFNYLLSQGIIVRPLHPYKMDSFIRVSIGTTQQNTRFLNALRSYYEYNKK